MSAELIAKLKKLAEDREERFTDSYSGRGMYGRTCVGITTDEPEDLIADAGIKGARTDSMGKRTIVYWPALSVEQAADG